MCGVEKAGEKTKSGTKGADQISCILQVNEIKTEKFYAKIMFGREKSFRFSDFVTAASRA